MRVEQFERHLARQKQARKDAEDLLESKSRELYTANQQLKQNQAHLEQRVQKRTEDLVKALKDLEDSRDHALQASKMKSEFLANMSHEIRTPLNGIVGTTELLLDTAEDRDQLDLLKTLRLSSETLLHLINDILDFSKIEQGKLELENRNFNLGELCDNVIQLFNSAAADKHLSLNKFYSPSPLPMVSGDPTRVRQILSNLVSNAIKFTHKGSVTLAVDVDRERSIVTFTISDTGIGIDCDKKDHLFEAFTQADNSITRKYGGSGLGLAICAQLTELMNGAISVESEIGAGSKFTFSVPLSIGGDDLVASSGIAHNYELEYSLWVLLVDDNLINRKVGARLLESMNCSVMLADSGQEAVDLSQNNDFDLVLMDIQMPGMDGTAAMEAIRALAKQSPPIVALTAHALQGDRDRYLAQGFDDYLEKPLKKQRLWEVLSATSNNPATQLTNDYSTSDELTRPVILNKTTHDDFVELMDNEYPALKERFAEDLRTDCQAILDSLNDPGYVQKTAHRLKSSAGYIGAERMHGILVWLEQNFESATIDEPETVARLAFQTAADTCETLDLIDQ